MRSRRVLLALAAALAAVMLLTGCGGGHKRTVVQDLCAPEASFSPGSSAGVKTSPEGLDYRESIALDDALAELDAYPCPEGVDAELFAQLKAALGEALQETRSGELQFATPLEVSRPGGRESVRIASTPPTGETNRVNDLAILDNGDGTFTLSWHYRNLGDYDQNGIVGIEDITPLAIHYGESYEAEDVNCLLAVIDGSGNGRIGIEDITPIAMYFGVEVTDYAVEGAVGAEGEYAEIGEVEMDDATGKDTGRAEFEYALTPGENGYFRVLPRDSDGTAGDASNVVGLALEVLSVSPLEVKEGTVVTFTAEVVGAGPIDYAWDFAGQAVPATSNELKPEVVLTREVGEFPASLTVTNPQGDVTYPFTLAKLSREWKFETILSNVEIMSSWPQMKVHGDRLWIHACEGALSPPPNANYLITGSPGNWEIEEVAFQGMLELNSEGRPGVAYSGGPFMDETLGFAELGDSGWQTTELEEAYLFNRVNLAYANGNEPVITFTMPDERIHLIEYFWRRDGEWERGIVDEPGHPAYDNRMRTVETTTDPEGNPVICYVAAVDTPEGIHIQLRVAWWDAQSETWELIPVESSWDEGVGATGYFPDIDFRNDRKLAVTYSNISREIEPDDRYDRLMYAVYDGETWEKEVVDERIHAGDNYEAKSLAYDLLGNAVIAYTHENPYDPDIGWDTDLEVRWFDGIQWQEYVLDEEGKTGHHPSAVVLTTGNPCIAYTDYSAKEVVLARYE